MCLFKTVLIGISTICIIVLFMVVALCKHAGDLVTNPLKNLFSSPLAAAALTLQDHVYGSRSNEYDIHDPLIQPVLDYWAKSCPGNGPHGVCALAESGNLQCVEFVTGAYALAGDPLPAAPNAEQFWDVYAKLPGWQEIPSPSAFPDAEKQAPNLGDLIVFRGGAHVENGQVTEDGHIGIVVNFTLPSATHDGSIEVAEGNGPGTRYPPLSTHPWIASSQSGNTYIMTVHPDYRIDAWGAYSLDGVAYSGMTVLGFLHDATFAQKMAQQTTTTTSLPQGLSRSMPYVDEAWNMAESVGIPPGYFVRQIQVESGFNPRAISPAGAIGIAQFLPSTAAGLANPLGPGTLDPWNPDQALLAAARMMADYTSRYHGNYAKALAAYNGGPGQVTRAEQQATEQGNPDLWITFLFPESRQYIQAIMGL